MKDTAILVPALALVGWTLGVLGLMGYRRIASRLHPKEFRLGESPAVPPHVAVVNRNYMNLLEVPVLFYVVALAYYVTAQASPAVVALAWAFVALRVAHSVVHLSYNNVLHRLGFFAAANVALIALWAMLLARLA